MGTSLWTRGWVGLAMLAAVWAAPGTVRAQDFERPGLYVSGGWSRLGEQFGNQLDDELENALEFDDADLSAGDTDIWSATLGVRLGSRFALELVGERYEDIPLDLRFGGTAIDGDLELTSAMLMGKLYLFTGRLQPYLMAGAGYMRGELDFGAIEEDANIALGRAGLGVETYLTENLVLGLQGAYSRGFGSDDFADEIRFFTVGGQIMLRF